MSMFSTTSASRHPAAVGDPPERIQVARPRGRSAGCRAPPAIAMSSALPRRARMPPWMCRVQRLHPAVEHLRRPGQLLDRRHRHARAPRGSAPCRRWTRSRRPARPARRRTATRPDLVADREQRPPDLFTTDPPRRTTPSLHGDPARGEQRDRLRQQPVLDLVQRARSASSGRHRRKRQRLLQQDRAGIGIHVVVVDQVHGHAGDADAMIAGRPGRRARRGTRGAATGCRLSIRPGNRATNSGERIRMQPAQHHQPGAVPLEEVGASSRSSVATSTRHHRPLPRARQPPRVGAGSRSTQATSIVAGRRSAPAGCCRSPRQHADPQRSVAPRRPRPTRAGHPRRLAPPTSSVRRRELDIVLADDAGEADAEVEHAAHLVLLDAQRRQPAEHGRPLPAGHRRSRAPRPRAAARVRLPGMPPPVMWAMPRTSTARPSSARTARA